MLFWRRAGRGAALTGARSTVPGFRFHSVPAFALLTLVVGGPGVLCAPPCSAASLQDAGSSAAAAKPQVHGRATWDDAYLYFALQVDDADVIGTNTAPLSHPDQDDSVAVYLQVGSDRPKAPDANTQAMIVSSAGGFTFLHGAPGQSSLVVRPLFTIKYAVTVQGTLNRQGDRDKGYTVEMAIPLQALGLDPQTLKAGTTIGLNVVARARGGKPPFSSLSPDVKTEADIANPSKWGRLVLANPDGTGGGATTSGETVVSPRVNNKVPTPTPPLIDGVFRAGEWPDASRYAFAAPGDKPAGTEAAKTPTSQETAANAALAAQEAERDAAAPALPLASGLSGLERLIFARYSLAYQGDLRKPIPARGVLAQDGRFLLHDQPLTGAGPWFTTDRIGWHRAQLLEMRRSGIDVALTEVGGPKGPEGAGDEKALLTLVTALREMAVHGEDAPALALYLNTPSLTPDGAKVDLSTEDGRTTLYNAIRRWMLIVTPDLRARVAFHPPVGGGATAAYPVFLSDGSVFNGLDNAEWSNDLRARFAREFGAQAAGATLLFVGGSHFSDPGAASSLAAVVPTGTSGPGSGPIKSYVMMPGYDKSGAPLVPRRDLATYREAWEAALNAAPTWFIVDSWDDFTRGTEIAPSRQYGSRYEDETRIYSVQIGGMKKHAVRWLRHNAPRRMRPGDIVQVELAVQNNGTTPLRPDDRVVLTYRWRQNGKVVAESPIHIPLSNTLRPTQSARLALGLGAVRLAGDGRLEPLPPGDYLVEIDMGIESQDGKSVAYFADEGDTALTVPVTVTPDVAESVQFESTTTPRLMQAGGTYPVLVKVRWTGTEPLPIGAATLTYQFQSSDGGTTYGTGSVPLDKPLVPGQWVTLVAALTVADNGGQPLTAATPENAANGAATGSYRLRWIVTRTAAVGTIPGEYVERVAVYPGDDEARFVTPVPVPDTMDANALVPITVQVTNRGVTDWAKGNFAVGYHWYYPDGVEATWNSPVTVAIDRTLKPNASAKVTVPVRCPDRDGEYVLAFDVFKQPGTYLSTLPVSGPSDIGLARVRIRGGRLTFVDLTKFYNVDGVASEATPGDGNLDGAGNALPAESFPPDRYGLAAAQPLAAPMLRGRKKLPAPKWDSIPAYPSSYYVEVEPTARLISFRYGSDADGEKNVVRCEGQTIAVPKGSFVGLHIAVAATGGAARPLVLTLKYRDGSTQTVKRGISDWHTVADPKDDPVALQVHRVRRKEGDKAAECVIRHAIFALNVTKQLESVTLPKDELLKVFAITLEK